MDTNHLPATDRQLAPYGYVYSVSEHSFGMRLRPATSKERYQVTLGRRIHVDGIPCSVEEPGS